MKYTFKSHFASDIEEYISLKEALGFSRSSYDKFLHSFDVFCCDHFPHESCLTKEVVDHWFCIRLGIEHQNGLHRRMIALKGFADFLQLKGKNSYQIPVGMIGKDNPFTPYIYTDREIETFFYSADTTKNRTSSNKNRELILPVIFRVLFCCGLRPQEVIKINYDQMDLLSGTIYIQDSKSHKDRIVPMSDQLTEICLKYEKFINPKNICRKYFFQNDNGKAYSINWLESQFKRCWKRTDFLFPLDHHPRLYDFRHNFATRKISEWLDQGLDVNTLLPYLGTYMGHSELENTFYYVHLIPERLIQTGLMDWSSIPEVPDYED